MYLEPSVDPFHTGEYFVQLINLENGINSYTIHGAVNYFPAYISKLLFKESYIVTTSIFIKLLSLLSSLLFTYICYLLLNQNKIKLKLCLFIFSISLGFISHRDLFLMLSILFFIKILHEISFNMKVKARRLILFGMIISLSVFWTFDRGIAGLVSIGIAYLYLIYYTKNYRLLISVMSFLISMIFLDLIFISTSVVHWFDNVLMLAKSSSQWRYDYSESVIGFLILSFLCLTYSLLIIMREFMSNKDYIYRTILVFLVLFSLIMFKSATNRADFSHFLLMFMSVFFVICLIIGKEGGYDLFFKFKMLKFFLISVCVVFFLLGVEYRSFSLFYFPFFIVILVVLKCGGGSLKVINILSFTFLSSFLLLFGFKSLSSKDDFNLERSASVGNYWVAQTLIANKETCIFDLTNNGVINALTELPTCTNYSYPIYAPFVDESKILEQLDKSKPNFIVYSTSFWSYAIDGKSMAVRYPQLEKYIELNYTFTSCKYDYCMKGKIKF